MAADYNSLKTGISSAIKSNGAGEITGDILQEQMFNIVDTLNEGKAEASKLTELESEVDLSFNPKGQVNSAFDFADNAESGVMSFTSNQVPVGLPNIDYSLGGTLITTRADKSVLKTYDRQVLVTPTIIATRVYVTDAWQDWVYEDLHFNSKGLVYSTSDFADNAQNGVISFTSTEVPKGMPNLDYGGGGTLITARAKIIGFTNFDRQVLVTPNAIATRPWANGAWTDWTTTIISPFVQKRNVNSTSDFANNALNGVISFTSTAVPVGLPNIDYSLGGTLITTRTNNLALSTYDRQVLITPTIIATRAYVADAWQEWSYDELSFHSKGLVNSTSDFTDNAPNGVISFTSTEVPVGLPSSFDYGGGGTLITTRANTNKFTNFDNQMLILQSAIAVRTWANGSWQGWRISEFPQFVQKKSVNSSSDFADNAQSGVISFTSYQVPIGLPDIDYSLGGTLITTRSNNLTLSTYDRQVLITPTIIATRAYVTDAWQGWSVSYIGQEVITCGEGKQYSRLRDAVAQGVKYGCKVLVYAGIYDLAQEFAEELANESGSGIELKNNVHVLFLPGAYVRCELPFSSWSYHQFEPFHAEGSFTLENLHIVSKNTRYSVHDDLWGTKEYKNSYINCHMEHTDEKENPNYVQCIGGGMGKNGYIEIVGGYYKSNPVNMPNGNEMQQCISYHNGPSAECDGKIVIRDVYLADKGYLRFGYYGPSTKITPVSVSGCRMYRDILLAEEAGNNDHIVNFEIISYNNEIVA